MVVFVALVAGGSAPQGCWRARHKRDVDVEENFGTRAYHTTPIEVQKLNNAPRTGTSSVFLLHYPNARNITNQTGLLDSRHLRLLRHSTIGYCECDFDAAEVPQLIE